MTEGNPMTDDIRGICRNPDHITSVAAARGLKRETLKSRVMTFAREAGPFGFIDEELFAIDKARPESSLRKRRTELAQAGWILDAGYDRKNSHGQASKVWVHREHSLNPPPLGAQPKPKRRTAEEERAAIVKWLRDCSQAARAHHADICLVEDDEVLSTVVTRMETFAFAADAVERADHLR